jgi:hypothetical protein
MSKGMTVLNFFQVKTVVNLFQVKTGLNQAMTGMGDEIKEFKSNTEEGPNQAAGDE